MTDSLLQRCREWLLNQSIGFALRQTGLITTLDISKDLAAFVEAERRAAALAQAKDFYDKQSWAFIRDRIAELEKEPK